LKRWIDASGTIAGSCSRGCVGEDPSVDLVPFANHIDKVIRRYYSPNTNPEDGLQDEDPERVIVDAAGVTASLAREIAAIGRRGEEQPSFYDFRVSEVSPWPMEQGGIWTELTETIKSKARFFGKVHTILDELLGDIRTLVSGAAIRQLTADDRIFRARRENAIKEADKVFESPATELTAPPRERARSGRMNAVGIRVFYGALREEIAVAEVRPPVGSRVVVGSFVPTRTLQVLDLAALRWPREYADIFSPNFDTLSKKLIFLSNLQDEISRPIQPYDEELEYVPTQVVSEYLANVIGLDGIAYKSAQTSQDILTEGSALLNRNVALFGAAAMTTAETDPTEAKTAGLTFLDGSQHMFDVTHVRVSYDKNMWAHYVDATPDEESKAT